MTTATHRTAEAQTEYSNAFRSGGTMPLGWVDTEMGRANRLSARCVAMGLPDTADKYKAMFEGLRDGRATR